MVTAGFGGKQQEADSGGTCLRAVPRQNVARDVVPSCTASKCGAIAVTRFGDAAKMWRGTWSRAVPRQNVARDVVPSCTASVPRQNVARDVVPSCPAPKCGAERGPELSRAKMWRGTWSRGVPRQNVARDVVPSCPAPKCGAIAVTGFGDALFILREIFISVKIREKLVFI